MLGDQAGQEAFAELALDVDRVGIATQTDDDGVIVHGLARPADVANPGRRVLIAGRDFPGRFRGRIAEDGFGALGIGLVRDFQVHDYGILQIWGRKVDEHCGGEFAIGNDDGGVVEGLHAGGAPAEFAHEALLTAFEKDVIAKLDGVIEPQIKAGEEIGEGVLKSEGHGNAADSDGGPDGFQLDIEIFENEQRGDDAEDHFGEKLNGFRRDRGAFGLGDPAIEKNLEDFGEEIEDENEDDDVEAAIDLAEDRAGDVEKAESRFEQENQENGRESLREDVDHFAVVGAGFAASPAAQEMDDDKADDPESDDEKGDFGAVDEPGVQL